MTQEPSLARTSHTGYRSAAATPATPEVRAVPNSQTGKLKEVKSLPRVTSQKDSTPHCTSCQGPGPLAT